MRLQVQTPTAAVVDEDVAKVVAETEDGHFALLPRHVDFVAALVPGVLAFAPAGEEASLCYVAVDEGILVKCGDDVRVSVRRAARGELATLARTVAEEFRRYDEHEQVARAAVARLEAAALRRLADLGGPHGE